MENLLKNGRSYPVSTTGQILYYWFGPAVVGSKIQIREQTGPIYMENYFSFYV